MGQKIFRGIFTLLGLAFGVGLFRLSKMLMVANGIKGGKPLTMWEQVGAAFIIAIIFGIIFFRLYPFFVRAMKKLRGGIDKEISQISTGKLLLGTLGLILGLIVAFLISPIYRFITQWTVFNNLNLISHRTFISGIMCHIFFVTTNILLEQRMFHQCLDPDNNGLVVSVVDHKTGKCALECLTLTSHSADRRAHV